MCFKVTHKAISSLQEKLGEVTLKVKWFQPPLSLHRYLSY